MKRKNNKKRGNDNNKAERVFIYLFLYTLLFIAIFLLIKASSIPKVSFDLKDFFEGMLVSGPLDKLKVSEYRDHMFGIAWFFSLISILFNLYFDSQKQFKLDKIIMSIHLPVSTILHVIIIICYF